jgi:hypothetical protein
MEGDFHNYLLMKKEINWPLWELLLHRMIGETVQLYYFNFKGNKGNDYQ